MKIVHKVFTDSSNLYPFPALMETLLNNEAEVMKTRHKCAGYEGDVSLDGKDPTGANTGLKAREINFNTTKVVRLSGRLHSDLWHQ